MKNNTATRRFTLLDSNDNTQTLVVTVERGEDSQETQDLLLEAAQDEAARLFPDHNEDSIWEA